MKKKIAVILFNLGGPNSSEKIKDFLFNLFYDKYIISIPNPFRWFLAKLISFFRYKKALDIYAKIGGKSPILEETKMQRDILAKELNDLNAEIFVAMRHSYPKISDILYDILKSEPSEIILLSLYPQYSTTTTKSFIEDAINQFKKVNYQGQIKALCCYPNLKGFTGFYIKNIRSAISDVKKGNDFIILFSAHGLPKKIVEEGDPYIWQISESVKTIVKNLNIKDLNYKITYQSKVGPVEWTKPNTDEEIERAAKNGKSIILVPIAFVSEHSETLVELDIDYANIAKSYQSQYIRIATPRDDKLFIEDLAEVVRDFAKEEVGFITSDRKIKICPANLKKCESINIRSCDIM